METAQGNTVRLFRDAIARRRIVRNVGVALCDVPVNGI
jgi:hypothetical protein